MLDRISAAQRAGMLMKDARITDQRLRPCVAIGPLLDQENVGDVIGHVLADDLRAGENETARQDGRGLGVACGKDNLPDLLLELAIGEGREQVERPMGDDIADSGEPFIEAHVDGDHRPEQFALGYRALPLAQPIFISLAKAGMEAEELLDFIPFRPGEFGEDEADLRADLKTSAVDAGPATHVEIRGLSHGRRRLHEMDALMIEAGVEHGSLAILAGRTFQHRGVMAFSAKP